VIYRTELEWAKETCKRQGYYVIQKDRVKELYGRNMISWIEWDRIKDDQVFRDHMWNATAHEIVGTLKKSNAIICDERDTSDGHYFQARITVIE
jgi:hypothetical protein